jgi:PBP1b-binding outer membrane lipoprotein LpoB
MRFTTLVFLIVFLGGCMLTSRYSSKSPNPTPSTPPISVTSLTDSQFSVIDSNADGKLDKHEISNAQPVDSTEHPIKIFGLLVGSISLICLIPAIPSIINFYKKNKSRDEKHQ